MIQACNPSFDSKGSVTCLSSVSVTRTEFRGQNNYFLISNHLTNELYELVDHIRKLKLRFIHNIAMLLIWKCEYTHFLPSFPPLMLPLPLARMPGAYYFSLDSIKCEINLLYSIKRFKTLDIFSSVTVEKILNVLLFTIWFPYL